MLGNISGVKSAVIRITRTIKRQESCQSSLLLKKEDARKEMNRSAKFRAWNRVLSISLILVMLGALGVLVNVVATPKTMGGFTEFYMLGENGEATYYPERVMVGEESYLTVGVVNREQQRVLYQIEITASGTRISEGISLQLENNEEWVGVLSFTPVVVSEKQEVELLLYKQGQNEPYGDLHLWLDIIE